MKSFLHKHTILFIYPFCWFSLALVSVWNPKIYTQQQPFTFMINPFGDTGNAGRIIDGCYERGLTLQCAEKLKEIFKKKCPSIRVILTRFPGERLEPLQNANFANRLKTDLYLNIQFYFQEHDLSQLTVYYFIQHPTDLWVHRPSTLSFIPYDQAHRSCSKQTQEWAHILAKELKKIAHSHSFMLQGGVYACPFKPLMGIHAPAFCIEIGLKNKDDWQRFIEPLASSFEKLIEYVQQQE